MKTNFSKSLMKYLLCFSVTIAILLTIGMAYLHIQWNSYYPYFSPNSLIYNINSKYLDYAREYDFIIAYHSISQDHSYPYKILASKSKDNWVLITRDDEWFINPNERNREDGIRNLSNKEANSILDSLKLYGLFNLPSEQSLVNKCDRYTNRRGYKMHQRIFEIEIIQGFKLRTGFYNREITCSEVNEWQQIDRMMKFFDSL